MEFIGKLSNDIKLFESEEKIIIFGAGDELFGLLNKLEKRNIKNRVICICDNDIKKQGNEINGLKICSLDYVKQHYKDALYIVYNRFCVEICEQLLERNIYKIHLIRS